MLSSGNVSMYSHDFSDCFVSPHVVRQVELALNVALNSSFLIQNPSILIQNSSILIQNSSILIQNSYKIQFLIQIATGSVPGSPQVLTCVPAIREKTYQAPACIYTTRERPALIYQAPACVYVRTIALEVMNVRVTVAIGDEYIPIHYKIIILLVKPVISSTKSIIFTSSIKRTHSPGRCRCRWGG